MTKLQPLGRGAEAKIRLRKSVLSHTTAAQTQGTVHVFHRPPLTLAHSKKKTLVSSLLSFNQTKAA